MKKPSREFIESKNLILKVLMHEKKCIRDLKEIEKLKLEFVRILSDKEYAELKEKEE